MFPHFLTRCVSRLLGLALVSWATARVGVHRLSLCLPYLGVIPSTLLRLPLDFIRVNSLRPIRRICTHSVDPSLPHFLGEFPGLGLALVGYPMLWSQRRTSNAHGAEISIQISVLAWVEPRTLASSGRERYH